MLLSASPSPASASWSGPFAIDHNGQTQLDAVACPTANECIAVDDLGQEVTFNPASPGTPTPATVDPAAGLAAVACPSSSQCTAVDPGGREVTFDPASRAASAPPLTCPATR